MKKVLFVCLGCLAFITSFAVKPISILKVEQISDSGSVDILPSVQQTKFDTLLAIDSNDKAYTIWSLNGNIQIANRGRLAKNWSDPITLTTSGTASQPQIVADGTTIWAAWLEFSDSNSIGKIYTKQGNGNWSLLGTFAEGELIYDLAAVATEGRLFLTYRAGNPNDIYVIMASTSSIANSEKLNTNNQPENEVPRIAVRYSNGTYYGGVVWSGNTKPGFEQEIRFRGFTSDGDAINVLYGEESIFPSFNGNYLNQAIVIRDTLFPVIVSQNASNNVSSAFIRPVSLGTEQTGAWTNTVGVQKTFDSNGVTPNLAIDSLGNITAVYAYGPKRERIASLTLPVGSDTWGDTVFVSGFELGPLFPSIAFDVNDNEICTWISENERSVYLSIRPKGEANWSHSHRLYTIPSGVPGRVQFMGLQGQTFNLPEYGVEVVWSVVDSNNNNYGSVRSAFERPAEGKLLFYNKYSRQYPARVTPE